MNVVGGSIQAQQYTCELIHLPFLASCLSIVFLPGESVSASKLETGMTFSPWPKGKKLVHLDLKGAPPRIEYLHKLIDLFSQLGADGLLVEYEDMFPYEGQLNLLQATVHPAYSHEEVLSLQDVARSRGLEVIPLVQTFGHMEFVLKHPSMLGLREVSHCLGTLNPHREDGLKLVLEMLRQVVERHPGLGTLHIGADEVYLLGEGEESKLWLSTPGRTVEQLFLGHVTRVAKAVKEAWPHLNLVMWDDMMRGMNHDTLKASGLVGLVQPMLWDYGPALDVHTTVSLLEKYSDAGLPTVWAASAFKGSTSVHTNVALTQRHVDNHLQWLKVADTVSPAVHLQGIALTGWQRYDHMSVLCELIPLALPSLAACLQTLIHGQFSSEVQANVTEILGVSSVEAEKIESHVNDSSFPGGRLAAAIVELVSMLNSNDVCGFEKNMYVRGWLSPYHRQRKAVSPLITMQIRTQATELLNILEQKVSTVREEMVRLYPRATAQEWIEQHVTPVVAPIQKIVEDITACLLEMTAQHSLPALVEQPRVT